VFQRERRESEREVSGVDELRRPSVRGNAGGQEIASRRHIASFVAVETSPGETCSSTAARRQTNPTQRSLSEWAPPARWLYFIHLALLN